MTYANIEKSGWEGVAKIILLESTGRACEDRTETKRYVIVMRIDVAISSMTRMFML
jgi:hypothetical protein